MEMNPDISPLKDYEQVESFQKTTAVVFDPAIGAAKFGTNEIVEESLVIDSRSELSPAQLVENKLTRILGDASVPASQLQVRGLLRAR
jgi:hypothetical protein